MIKLLFPKNVTIISSFCSSSALPRPLLLQICHFSASSYNHSFLRPRDDETRDDRNVPISVWWEFDSCNLPADVNGYRITHWLTEALRAKGMKGPLQIKAFGDVLRLSTANQEALSSTGINLVHIPDGGKNPAHGSLLVDLMHWVSKNPPPAHLFLITDNRAFADMLHRLRLDNYNILLAAPARAPNVLCNAATIMWHWNSLITGENLDGKHFNNPPDGLDGSWYGYHKVTLEDPFLDGEQSQVEEMSAPISDLELRTVPKAVVRQVREILNLYPTGISVTDIRAEIAKAGIFLDKNYHGHKKFTRFLLSVADVQLRPGPDKSLFVHPIPQKCTGPFDSSSVSSTVSDYGKESNQVAPSKSSGEVKKVVGDADLKPSTVSVDVEMNQLATSKLSGEVEKSFGDADVKPSMNSSQVPEKVQQVVDVVSTYTTESQLPLKENEIFSSSDVSLSATEKNTTSENYSTEQSKTVSDKNASSNDISGELKAEDKYDKSTIKESDAVCHVAHSLPVDDCVTDKSIGESIETNSKNFGKRRSFFAWISSWWPIRKNRRNSNNLTDQPNEMLSNIEEPKVSNLNQTTCHSEESESSDLKQTVCHSEESEFTEQKQTVSHSEEPKLSEPRQKVNYYVEPELFSSGTFWSDMESFVFSGKGSTLISRSKNRKDLMQKIQKYGPQVLSSLSENDLLQLGNMLISKKKWLEERPFLTLPFLVSLQDRKKAVGLSHGATGLRSLFLIKEAQNNFQKSSDGDIDKRYQSIPQAGVSSPAIKNRHTEKSRTDILADIQKLVSDIVREHSDGYNMGMIPKLFLERYGYPLDAQKLGYQKLATLLQIVPGVKVESSYIFPVGHPAFSADMEMSTLNTSVNNSSGVVLDSDRESSDSCRKEDRKDTAWEELGPVSISNPKQSDLETKSREKALKLETSIHPHYEPSVSDDDSSESEGDSSCLTQSEEEVRSKHNVEDSSLLQTLESFYRSQEEGGVQSENTDTKGNGLTGGLNPSRHSTPGVLSKTHSGAVHKEKQRPHKSYSFVADPDSRKKDELIDGILQNLRKSDELRMRS
ncbi:hypothetical protein QN277_025939 [Acacia crassicarpa]|uniref:HTH OST-type domain-containing protein n=1 Tax=Acacia crassicarpa TaxID=499986 RepID=A0AAE1J952_9FABA|nr:hypothetical protein QN277_025939 [Acacia crassicarpa]